MAITYLSPWPKSGADLATATSILKDAINPGMANADAERLGATASARVEHFGALAPDVMRTEALIRFAGYLYESQQNQFGALRDKAIDLDSVRMTEAFTTSHAAAFRNCGAMALLSPWKKRRAGAIGKDKPEIKIMPPETLDNIEITQTPVNIADGLTSGSYQFQRTRGSGPIFYAYGDAAPSNLNDYFNSVDHADIIGFTVVEGTRLWLRLGQAPDPEFPVRIALARL